MSTRRNLARGVAAAGVAAAAIAAGGGAAGAAPTPTSLERSTVDAYLGRSTTFPNPCTHGICLDGGIWDRPELVVNPVCTHGICIDDVVWKVPTWTGGPGFPPGIPDDLHLDVGQLGRIGQQFGR